MDRENEAEGPVSEGNGELLPLPPPRKVLLRHGIYTVEKDASGRYWLFVPDGKRGEGLTKAEMRDLGRALRKIARMEKEAGRLMPPGP